MNKSELFLPYFRWSRSSQWVSTVCWWCLLCCQWWIYFGSGRLPRVWSKLFQKQNIASDDSTTFPAAWWSIKRSSSHCFSTVAINSFSFHLQITILVWFSRIVYLALLNWIIFIFMIKFILKYNLKIVSIKWVVVTWLGWKKITGTKSKQIIYYRGKKWKEKRR